MTWAQYGEDDLIDGFLGWPQIGTIVDIGAGDGIEISNSRLFRERGWFTILIEADPTHADALASLQASPRVMVHNHPATPENINDLVPSETDVLSIDVDGDDYFLLEALEQAPRIVVIEHNPTIPYRFDVCPDRPGLRCGASVAALTRLAHAKDYGRVAVTHCNVIFELGAEDMPLPVWEPEYAVATEYFTGRPFTIGVPPWGVAYEEPYPAENVNER